VTGGAGFIGSHLVDRLVAEDYEVRVLDNLSTGRLVNLRRHLAKKSYEFIRGDIINPSVLRRALEGVEVVFHEAAQVSVPQSIAHPVLTNQTNTTGTLMLLEASAKCGVDKVIYASSSSVYGEQARQPIKEDSAAKSPLSPYAVSKAAAEQYCLTFHRLGKLDAVCLRYFNVYGPRQRDNPYSGVITIFANRLRKNRPPIIYGDGKQTRDFVSVRDVVQANMLAMCSKKGAGEVFNIGTGTRTTINELAKMMIRASGKRNLRPIHAAPRPGDVRNSCAEIRKARRILGYSPTVTLRDYVEQLTPILR
jgi:UDP-glucose 4-epimerase